MIGLVCHSHVWCGSICVAKNSNRPNTHFSTGSNDADRDFTTVGDQNLPDGPMVRHEKGLPLMA